MAGIVTDLIQSSLCTSSLPTYKRAWQLLKQFFLHSFGIKDISVPISPANLALFIAYLYDAGYASATVKTYVSSIGYFHRLADVRDPTKVGYIMEMLRGYGKLRSSVDNRLPVTVPILQKAFDLLPQLSISHYQSVLFKAMSSLAFFAFLRMGEITIRSVHETCKVLQLSQILTLTNQHGHPTSVKITFQNFKHSYNLPPVSLVISRQLNGTVCPVQRLLDYLRLRGTAAGPLFLNEDRQPVQRKAFADLLAMVFHHLGLPCSNYKGHSFRIGAASLAAEQGLSDAQIRLMGRWKSNAFKKYIRVNSFSANVSN